MKTAFSNLALALTLLPAGVGFAGNKTVETVVKKNTETVTSDLMNTKGEVIGQIALSQVNNRGVKLHLKASGLAPGKHGIHFHETGKCETPDFKSAGNHFKVAGQEHGLKNPKGPHLGDLPNLEVKDDGTAVLDAVVKRVSLSEGKNSLLKPGGTAIVVHAKSDDQHSEPSGDSGDRVACAVVEL